MSRESEAVIRLLIVDDRADDRALIRTFLAGDLRSQYQIVEADSGSDGLRKCLSEPPDCVLLDYQMPGIDGLEFLRLLKQGRDSTPMAVVMLTGYGQQDIDLAAIRSGAQDYLSKDRVDAVALGRTIRHALDRHLILSMLRTREEELRLARDEAVRASRVKSEFLANMSHEIRTPMNGIIGMLEVLTDAHLTTAEREAVEAIRFSSESLLTIINDILDLSKIEAGMLSLKNAELDIRDVVKRAVAALHPGAVAKGLRLQARIDDELPHALCGDRMRLHQVLTNLVSNAIKFTERGDVSVAVSLEASTDADATLRFEVTDTGIGISADSQSALFMPFVQLDSSTTRRHGGTGLGLVISKKLVKLMGGEIGLISKLGSGSTFWFTARLAKPNALNVSAEPVESAAAEGGGIINANWRVLAADDNPVNQAVARHLLGGLGLQAHFVEDGYQALDALQRVPYDIVLMDCQMPGLDGFGATAQIRASEGSERRTWIIAMTAHAMDGDREKCLSAGMDDYIAKPVTAQALREALKRYDQHGHGGAAPCAC